MGERLFSRRQFIAATGASLTMTGLGVSTASAQTGWTKDQIPTNNTLYDIELAHIDFSTAKLYIVGGEGEVFMKINNAFPHHETFNPKEWTKVLNNGPSGNSNDLYGSALVRHPEQADPPGFFEPIQTFGPVSIPQLWVVGASGAIGDLMNPFPNQPALTDHSKPMGVTEKFNDVAAERVESGEVFVYVASESGKIYYSFTSGKDGTWNAVQPGNGAPITAIDFLDQRRGFAVDENQTVFATADGETWNAIGIQDATHNLYGINIRDEHNISFCGDGGIVWTGNGRGTNWNSRDLGDGGLRDIERGYTIHSTRIQNQFGDDYPKHTTVQESLTVGNGGRVYRYVGRSWEEEKTPTSENLKAVLSGIKHRHSHDIAIGSGGTVIQER